MSLSFKSDYKELDPYQNCNRSRHIYDIMKKWLLIFTISLIVLATFGILFVNLWIKSDVKANIHLAQQKYPGTPEEALIAYLEDNSNSKIDQTHIAIWTLGQIESEKALTVLKRYYRDDPEGETCHEHHHQELCQYELFKAIQNIEKGKLFHIQISSKALQ